jgi:hypothetical protein
MYSDAFILRTAASGGDPLTALKDLFPVGLILRDIGIRHHTASQDAALKYYFEWREQRLWEMYGDEIDHPAVEYELEQQFRQMTQWKYLLR